jgi:hypothetical protein
VPVIPFLIILLIVFITPFPVEGEELSDAVKKEGFPVAHRHRLVSLRQELIEAFVE